MECLDFVFDVVLVVVLVFVLEVIRGWLGRHRIRNHLSRTVFVIRE